MIYEFKIRLQKRQIKILCCGDFYH